jgi:MerR family transcriptional regulator, thiopeptide resistance regulator
VSKNNDKFTVGELARRGGVSVRTLQYYDKIGLLAPNEYSGGGRRMYGGMDIFRLQQILFLKTMGFPLEEIRDKLLPKGSGTDIGKVFQVQKAAIDDQIKHLQEAANLLDKVIHEVRMGNEIGIDNLFAIIAAIQTGNPYAFMMRHFDQEQMEFFLNRFKDEQEGLEFDRISQGLNDRLMLLYRQCADPSEAEAQELAAQWWELTMSVTKGDPEMLRKMFNVASDESHWPSEKRDLKDANEKLLGQALILYFQKNGIKMPFAER